MVDRNSGKKVKEGSKLRRSMYTRVNRMDPSTVQRGKHAKPPKKGTFQ